MKLLTANELSLKIWNVCNEFSRPVAGLGGFLKLPISEIKATCDEHNGDHSDFEKVLLIENTVYPYIVGKNKKKDS
jgi:hypothetical protein